MRNRWWRPVIRISGIREKIPAWDYSFLMFMMLFGTLINAMDRSVIGVLAPFIKDDLRLDAEQMGYIFGAFSFGYMAFVVIGGWASDRFGSLLVMLISMAIWSALCGVTGLIGSFTLMLVVRFLFGAAESPWYPATAKLQALAFPPSRYATVNALCSAGSPLGSALAGPVAGLTATLIGWRLAIMGVAAVGFLWVALWFGYILFRRYHPSSPGLPQLKLRNHPASAAEPSEAAPNVSLGSAIRTPVMLSTALAMSAAMYSMSFFQSWMPSYIHTEFGVSVKRMSILLTIPWVISLAGIIMGGYLSDWLGRRLSDRLAARTRIVAACQFLASALMLSVPFVPPMVAFAHMTLALWLISLASVNYMAIANDVCGSGNLASIIAAMITFGNLMAAVAPIVSGYIIKSTGSYDGAFIVDAAVLAAAAGAVLFHIHRFPARRMGLSC